VASMASQFVVIVDERQAGFLDWDPPSTSLLSHCSGHWLRKPMLVIRLGGTAAVADGVNKDGPLVTDNGQLVIDVKVWSRSRSAPGRCPPTPHARCRRDGAVLRYGRQGLVGVSDACASGPWNARLEKRGSGQRGQLFLTARRLSRHC